MFSEKLARLGMDNLAASKEPESNMVECNLTCNLTDKSSKLTLGAWINTKHRHIQIVS
jgi:hypothetical protein